MRVVRRTAVAIVGCLVLLSCGSARGGDTADRADAVVRAHGTPVLAAALSPSGTELGDGFVVPEGSSLIGRPLPDSRYTGYPNDLEAPRRWTALLFVGGDAVAVTNDLVRQAAHQGLRVIDEFAPAGDGCRETGGHRPATGVDPPLSQTRRPVGIRCIVGTGTSDLLAGTALARRSVRIVATQGKCSSCDGGIAPSIATVSYSDFEPGRTDPAVEAKRWPESGGAAATKGALTLPVPGSVLHLAEGITLRVLDGSRPLTVPVGGVVLMSADGKATFDAYAQAMRTRTWDSIEENHEQRDKWTVDIISFGGGRPYVADELFEQPNQPTYLRITGGSQ